MKVAVVTGANRGLGLELCRRLSEKGYHVILTARNAEAGQSAATKLGVEFRPLDVSDPASIASFAEKITERHGRVDVLIHNAGVSLDGFDDGIVKSTLATNFYGPLRLTAALEPILAPNAQVIMVSSERGELACLGLELADRFSSDALTREELVALMQKFAEDVAFDQHLIKGWPSSAYRVSKVGLNALVRVLHREWVEDARKLRVNAVDPGWVRTDMGGSSAPKSVSEGVDTILWLVRQEGDDAPSGGYFRDRAASKW